MLVAHRGIHNNLDIPENSILAFKRCLELKTAIELDIQLTSDNELVVFHDDNLKRMTGIDAIVEDLSLDEIKNLRLLDTKEKIPRLEEILTLVNGRVLIDIEVKNTKRIKTVCNRLINILNSYNGDIIIKSFNPKIIRYLRKLNNTYTYGLLIMKIYPKKIHTLIIKSNLILLYCRPDFLAISKELAKTKRFKKLRKKYPIYIWTIKNVNEIQKYKNYGEHYICNNLPY